MSGPTFHFIIPATIGPRLDEAAREVQRQKSFLRVVRSLGLDYTGAASSIIAKVEQEWWEDNRLRRLLPDFEVLQRAEDQLRRWCPYFEDLWHARDQFHRLILEPVWTLLDPATTPQDKWLAAQRLALVLTTHRNPLIKPILDRLPVSRKEELLEKVAPGFFVVAASEANQLVRIRLGVSWKKTRSGRIKPMKPRDLPDLEAREWLINRVYTHIESWILEEAVGKLEIEELDHQNESQIAAGESDQDYQADLFEAIIQTSQTEHSSPLDGLIAAEAVETSSDCSDALKVLLSHTSKSETRFLTAVLTMLKEDTSKSANEAITQVCCDLHLTKDYKRKLIQRIRSKPVS